jgi:hypothetical protein
LVTEGISRKQRAPREVPKPPPPPQEQAAMDEVLDDDEPTMCRAKCVAWPIEQKGLVMCFYDSTVGSTKVGLMPQIPL